MLNGRQAAWVSTAFMCVGLILLLLRCISRFAIIRQGRIDDLLAICAFICAVGVVIILWFQQSHGLGRESKYVSYLDLVIIFKTVWIGILVYQTGVMLTKLSALFQYLRFITYAHHKMRFFCWLMIVVISLNGVIATGINIFSCKPIAYFWNKELSGSCLRLDQWWRIGTIVNVITDFVVVTIPIITLKDLQLPRMQKTLLLMVFGLGGADCIISIFRAVELYELTGRYGGSGIEAEAGMWSSIELSIGITCICAPTLKPVFNVARKYFKPDSDKVVCLPDESEKD